MTRFADIIGLWPSAADFGRDVGVSEVRARAWKNRNSIPPRFWRLVVAAAGRRGIEQVTLEALACCAEGAADEAVRPHAAAA